MVDARLPDGSRVNVIIPPVAPNSPTITLRKFRVDKMTIEDLIATGSIPREMAEFFRACVQVRLNTLVSGGTGTGKTTMLNALSSFIPDTERIVTIEDPTELRLQQGHVVVRGPEAFDMMQAMNTGHEGSLSTVHANTPRDALARIENMILMAGLDLPIRAIREQIASAIHVVIQIARLPDGSRRVTHVSEINGMEGDVVTMQDLFRFEQRGIDADGRVVGEFRSTGLRPAFADKFEIAGIHLPPDLFAPGLR
jgi:pilus assembly protein CpaF